MWSETGSKHDKSKYQHCCKPTGTSREGGKWLWGNLIIKFKISIIYLALKIQESYNFEKAFLCKLYTKSWAQSNKIDKITGRIKFTSRVIRTFEWVMYSEISFISENWFNKCIVCTVDTLAVCWGYRKMRWKRRLKCVLFHILWLCLVCLRSLYMDKIMSGNFPFYLLRPYFLLMV